MPVVKKYYTVSEKLAILKILNRRRLDNNSSYHEIARELGVDPSQLRRWEQQSAKLEAFYSKRKRNAKALHDGYKSQLSHIEEELLEYIFEGCEQGLPMTIRLVTAKASELDDTFRRKSMVAKEHAIRRFVKAHGLVHRVHTHESQRSLAEAEEQATEFVLQMRPLLAERNRSQDYIINMDQTPIFSLWSHGQLLVPLVHGLFMFVPQPRRQCELQFQCALLPLEECFLRSLFSKASQMEEFSVNLQDTTKGLSMLSRRMLGWTKE